jgi:O-antigen ligase
MGRNEQDSSRTFSFGEQIRSISNISTDASNVERLNRWIAAFGIIEDYPVLGCGPGTYQFIYAAYQKGKYKTTISTNFGNGGNAHSEYIGPWAETGLPGVMTIIAMMIVVLYLGIKTYIKTQDKTAKILSLSAILALISYYIHGVMNNFLDTDKLSLPFWGAFVIIVVLNIRLKHEQS